MRLGLGCLRLVADAEAGREALRAALDGGVTTFDTGRAYGSSEALLGEVLRAHPRGAAARVVTKCGMRRDGDAWIPDGRAAAILDDARASVDALGRPADLLLLHAPDPKTPLATSVRAMLRAKDAGAARALGLSNVGRREIEEASAIAPIVAVEIALGTHDDAAARGGLVAWCAARGIEILAHSPLGGPKRAHKLANDGHLRDAAARLGLTGAELVLAYLLALSPSVTPLVGAKTRAQVESMLRAGRAALDDASLAALDARFRGLATARRPLVPLAPSDARAEVVLMMGVAGAGKSRAVAAWTARGYERLNRDALGGTLRGIVQRLDALLAGGATCVVLDNTYLTRASRSDVVRAAHARGAAVRCVFFDTPLAEAEINIATRMLERHGALLGSLDLKARARRDPNLMPPGPLFRMARELERPAADEGFSAIEIVPFVREHAPGGVAGAAIALELVARPDLAPHPDAPALIARAAGPVLVFGWRPGVAPERVRALENSLGSAVKIALCTHPAGPPSCWCRPPLPGLWLEFARERGVDPRRSTMLGASPAHRTMARALGLAYEEVSR